MRNGGNAGCLDTKLQKVESTPKVGLSQQRPSISESQAKACLILGVHTQKRWPILFSKSVSFLGFEIAKFFQMLAPDGPVINQRVFHDTFQNMSSVYEPEESPFLTGLLLFGSLMPPAK